MSFKTIGWVAGATTLSVAAWQAHLYCVETSEMLEESTKRLQKLNSDKPIYNQSLENILTREVVQKEVDELSATDRKCNFFKNYFSHKH